MDHELKCVLRNPSVEAIHKFESRMTSSQNSWTVSMTETLLSAVNKRPSLLYLLARAEIDDHVIYAVQQHLPNLTNQVLLNEQSSQGVAIVSVVRIWEALERLRSLSSSVAVDTLWIYSHVEPSKLNDMARVAVNVISR